MTESTPITILDSIPFHLDVEQFVAGRAMGVAGAFLDDIRSLAREAEAVAKPKGLYKLAAVECGEDTVVQIDGVTFNSRILCVNLKEAHRVFPFLATCGVELDAWSETVADVMHRFWADKIKEAALGIAIQALGDDLAARYRPGKHAAMNPGSLADWPVSQQKPLFALFGGAAAAIGVRLNDSFTMSPIKSVSGLWFETEQGFQNCQLCPRGKCPNRRAPYDPHLFAEKYQA